MLTYTSGVWFKLLPVAGALALALSGSSPAGLAQRAADKARA